MVRENGTCKTTASVFVSVRPIWTVVGANDGVCATASVAFHAFASVTMNILLFLLLETEKIEIKPT